MTLHRTGRRRWAFWGTAGAVLTVFAVFLAARLAGATMPYNPLFEMTGISSTAPSANANITFRTPLLTTQVDECWDELACLTFVRDPLSVTKLCGVNASCGVAAACPTVP